MDCMLSFFLYFISLYCFSSFTIISLQIPLFFLIYIFFLHLQCFSDPNSVILNFAVWYCDLNIWSWRLLSISKCSFCVSLSLSPSLNLLLHLSCLHIYFYCSQVFHLRLLVTHNPLYGSKSTFWKLFVAFDCVILSFGASAIWNKISENRLDLIKRLIL